MFDVPSTPCLNTRGKSCHRLQAHSGCGAASKTTAAKPPRRLMRTRLVALALGLACSLPLAFGPGFAQAEARDTQIHAIRGFMPDQIGRASCRERVEISECARSVKEKNNPGTSPEKPSCT